MGFFGSDQPSSASVNVAQNYQDAAAATAQNQATAAAQAKAVTDAQNQAAILNLQEQQAQAARDQQIAAQVLAQQQASAARVAAAQKKQEQDALDLARKNGLNSSAGLLGGGSDGTLLSDSGGGFRSIFLGR